MLNIDTLNKDHKLRDDLLAQYFTQAKYMGGIKYYNGLDVAMLTTLVEMKFADLDEAQNCSPTIRDFLDFMIVHPEVTAHGYVVSPHRGDYRLTIEGLECSGKLSDKLITDFVSLCDGADELTVDDDYLRSWWD